MKRPFMVWIGFISICCSKVAKEGKSCRRLLVLQRVAQNAKSCSKVAEHNLFMQLVYRHSTQILRNTEFKYDVTGLKTPTGTEEATSWLFISCIAEELNSARPRTNPASGRSGIRTRDRQIANPTRWPLGHAVSSNFSFLKLSTAGSLELHSFVGWTTYASFSNQYSKWEKHFYPDEYISFLHPDQTAWKAVLCTWPVHVNC